MSLARHQFKQDAGADRASFDAAVVAEQVRLLLRKRLDLPINLLNIGIVCAAFRSLYPVWVLVVWLGLFSIVIPARSLIRRRYRVAAPGPVKAARWGHIFALNAFATGCLWGLTGSVILITPNPAYQVLIVFVLGGMMAGGIVTNAAYKPAMIAFMLPTVLPVIAILITRADITHIEMGLMLAAFTAVLIIAGRNINRSIIENFRLRIRQDSLLAELRVSEAAMIEAQEMAHVGSWEIDLKTHSGVMSIETNKIFGVDPGTFKPSYDAMLARVHPGDRVAVGKDFALTVATGAGQGIDHRLVMDNGAIKYVHGRARITLDSEGHARRMNGTMQDITERKVAEDKLQFANILLKTEMEASPDGILVVDANRRIISFNQRFADMWKIPAEDLAGANLGIALAKATPLFKDPTTFIARANYLFDHPEENSEEEYGTTDGRSVNRSIRTLTTLGGDYLGRVWFFHDVTARKLAEARALRIARFDGLTGLANRIVFVEALQNAVVRAKRGEIGFAVIYLDLDHFKDVNDTLGHPVGDALLQAVAERLQSTTRESDTVARFGGDEFAVVVAGVGGPADAAILAGKLIDTLSNPYTIEGNDIYSGASIGIDLYGPEASDAETLLSHADVALYRAKSEGRGAYRFFTDAMDVEVRRQVSLGTELHEALSSGQLFILYQPLVAIDSARITGVEALVRWRHPQRGILGPELFIPVAEKTGLIVKLSHWVLLTACQQAKAWLDAGIAPIRTSVKLSAAQFKSPIALEAAIAAILAETGLPPRLLEVELTETVLMSASPQQSNIVLRLRQVGVTIAIDGFGTGYSALDYLRRFPVDRIKIAQTFVRHLETLPGNATIVKATISLARDLGFMVLAEGVENQKQFEMLEGWGCGEVQGSYFSKPLPAEDVTLLLRNGGSGELSNIEPT